jgi:hypothetical protein
MERMDGLLLSTYVESITTRKDKSVKITLGTQELSPETAGQLFQFMNALAATYICKKGIDQKEIDQVDQLQPDIQGKSQSQRIRSVLFLLFKQSPEGFKDFDSFYKAKTETYIEHLKNKLQPDF